MKTIEMTIQVPSERIVTLKLPDDVLPGTHRVLVVIEESSTAPSHTQPLFNPEGMWAGQNTDISPQDIAEARREMWGKFDRED